MGVKEKNNRFRAIDMFTLLKSDHAEELSITGIVKENDGDPHAVYLSVPPNANSWLSIPEDHISNFEAITKINIDGSDHRIVRLTLKRPSSPEGALFHDLLTAQLSGARALAQHVASDAGKPPETGTYCYYDATGRWICV